MKSNRKSFHPVHAVWRTAPSLCVLAFSAVSLFAPTAEALVIPINPGPIGSIYGSVDFSFADLNGTVAQGQQLSLDFTFPTGIEAAYRYDSTKGPRILYGWNLAFNLGGGYTITIPMTSPSLVVALDNAGNPVGPSVGTGGLYNTTFADYYGNANEQNSHAALVALTDLPYHGVRMNIQMPAYSGPETITSASFGFRNYTASDIAETTQIVPEPSAALLVLSGVALCLRRRSLRPSERNG
jgi:hypothetical protein